MKNKGFGFFLSGVFTLLSLSLFAQELPLILNKQDTFEILSRTDYAGPDCSFTKTEMIANLQKINDLVVIVHKNQVLSEMNGFDGRAIIYTTIEGYPKIIKPNPEYWDKSKPKSDIQIITFRMIQNRNFLEQRTKEYLQKNSIRYHCAGFEESFDIEYIRSVVPMIKK